MVIVRNDYNVTILKQTQAIFGHLAETQLQYYVPKVSIFLYSFSWLFSYILYCEKYKKMLKGYVLSEKLDPDTHPGSILIRASGSDT